MPPRRRSPRARSFLPGHVAQGVGLLVAAVGYAGASLALLRLGNDDFDLAPARV